MNYKERQKLKPCPKIAFMEYVWTNVLTYFSIQVTELPCVIIRMHLLVRKQPQNLNSTINLKNQCILNNNSDIKFQKTTKQALFKKTKKNRIVMYSDPRNQSQMTCVQPKVGNDYMCCSKQFLVYVTSTLQHNTKAELVACRRKRKKYESFDVQLV